MAEAIKNILSDETKLHEVVKAAFESVNTDKSGKITPAQLESAMDQISKDLGNELPTKNDVEEVVKHLDTNKDGLIEFNEFKVLIVDVLKSMVKRLS